MIVNLAFRLVMLSFTDFMSHPSVNTWAQYFENKSQENSQHLPWFKPRKFLLDNLAFGLVRVRLLFSNKIIYIRKYLF